MRDTTVLEVAVLNVIEGATLDFLAAFKIAEKIISSAKGYISHDLMKCSEKSNQFLLLVKWESLEDHEIGFRKSEPYKEWKKLLHHFYDPFPTVEHYEHVLN